MDKIKKYLPLISAGCAALALILGLALPALKSGADSMSGWETVFPAEVMAMLMTMPFLTIALVIAGGVTAALAYMHPEKKMIAYVSTACLAVAGIFFFCWKAFYCNAVGQDFAKEMMKMLDLGIGCILGGILSLVAAVCSGLFAFLKD